MLSIRKSSLAAACLGAALTNAAPLLAQSQLVDFSGFALATEAYYQMPDPGSTTLSTAAVQLPHETPSWGGFSDFTVSNRTDTTTGDFSNPASAFPGSGHGDSQYAVGFGDGLTLTFDSPGGVQPESVSLTNTTYTALSMRNGDDFSKQFGGPSGDDPDFFHLTLTGLDSTGTPLGNVVFPLADFTFSDNSLDYIVDQWTEIDLTALGSGVAAIEFTFQSSDMGDFGINTPTYFAMDNLAYSAVPEPAQTTLFLLILAASLCFLKRKKG